MQSMARMDDTQSVISMPAPHRRRTKDGRTLWYRLRVIQQPERARACGSGPKSSADRRPVDPPPVVELRIFDGRTLEEALNKDITFIYNANFFLYATLEHARPVAHGRVQTPAANAPPVLTGMPVSGMAYLDRPEEAGYFLFPDLSVRHEGRYRLVFNLYEETKEDKDRDPSAPDAPVLPAGMADATGGSFDFRMEMKSDDFVVFSAKKFPGLAESTNLSRMVAEQGCRVRIRRDVRMRRREGKGAGGGRDYEANGNGASSSKKEDEYVRRRRSDDSPDNDPYLARSVSGSVEGAAYQAAEGRRPVPVSDYSHFGPRTPKHLSFQANHKSQYPPHAMHSTPLPHSPSYPPAPSSAYPSQTPTYPPHQPGYGPLPSYLAPPPPPPPYHTERPPPQSCGFPNAPGQRSGLTFDPVRKASASSVVSLPPLQSWMTPSSYSNADNRLPSVSSIAPPALPSPSLPVARSQSNMMLPSQLPPVPPVTGKRSRYDGGAEWDDRRFTDGARSTGEEAAEPEPFSFSYRRADGFEKEIQFLRPP